MRGGRGDWAACDGTGREAERITDHGLGWSAEHGIVQAHKHPGPLEIVHRFPRGVCPTCKSVQATDTTGVLRRHADHREDNHR